MNKYKIKNEIKGSGSAGLIGLVEEMAIQDSSQTVTWLLLTALTQVSSGGEHRGEREDTTYVHV